MRKRYVKALVLDADGYTKDQLAKGSIVTLDLHDTEDGQRYANEPELRVQVVGATHGRNFISRFAIDPIISTRGN